MVKRRTKPREEPSVSGHPKAPQNEEPVPLVGGEVSVVDPSTAQPLGKPADGFGAPGIEPASSSPLSGGATAAAAPRRKVQSLPGGEAASTEPVSLSSQSVSEAVSGQKAERTLSGGAEDGIAADADGSSGRDDWEKTGAIETITAGESNRDNDGGAAAAAALKVSSVDLLLSSTLRPAAARPLMGNEEEEAFGFNFSGISPAAAAAASSSLNWLSLLPSKLAKQRLPLQQQQQQMEGQRQPLQPQEQRLRSLQQLRAAKRGRGAAPALSSPPPKPASDHPFGLPPPSDDTSSLIASAAAAVSPIASLPDRSAQPDRAADPRSSGIGREHPTQGSRAERPETEALRQQWSDVSHQGSASNPPPQAPSYGPSEGSPEVVGSSIATYRADGRSEGRDASSSSGPRAGGVHSSSSSTSSTSSSSAARAKEADSRTVFVKGLDSSVPERALRAALVEAFGKCGRVMQVWGSVEWVMQVCHWELNLYL